jgi:plastocyanin
MIYISGLRWQGKSCGVNSLNKYPGVSTAAVFVLAILLIITLLVPVNTYASAGKQIARFSAGNSTPYQSVGNTSIPEQLPTTREIIIEWMKTQAGQDRFYPDFFIVNQWDTVDLVLINNDTVAHDFVMGPPYNIVVNATVPGLYNDLTGQKFTTPALHNSPGVVVTGRPGNVSATLSFVAKYPGVFEFVCGYHIQVGMIGYMVVLAPNASNVTQPFQPNQTVPQSSTVVPVSVDSGSGLNVNLPGYTPANITVVIGVNNTVRWTNNDNMAHTVTARDGSFDSGNLNPGATFVHTFTTPGVYHYTCTYHSWMQGTVTVVTEALGQESQEHGEFTVVLTANEVYGIIALGIVVVLAVAMIVGRTSRKNERIANPSS